MPKINSLSQRQAVQLASKMRNQMRNATMERKTLLSHAGRIGGAALGSWGVGWWMGGLEHEYQMNQAAIDAGTADDPRQLFGFLDIELGIAGVALLIGLAGQGVVGNKKGGTAKWLGSAASLIEGVGIGAMSGYLYSVGQDSGQASAAALPGV